MGLALSYTVQAAFHAYAERNNVFASNEPACDTMVPMQNLRATLRIHAVCLACLIVLSMAGIAMVDADRLLRIFAAILCLVLSAVLIAEYRKERSLAEMHLVFCGTVTKVAPGRRGTLRIEYEFTAADGKMYQGESDWGSRSLATGTKLLVLSRPDAPRVNKPLPRFLFYTFHRYGGEEGVTT